MKINSDTTDIVVLITGLSGAGKSTFINALLDKKDCMPVGHSLVPCTTEVDCGIIDPIPGHPEMKGRRLIVVDTPGFNNTYNNDTKVLLQIADWLEARCPDKIILGGVIYLHEIHQDRFATMTGTDLNLLRHSLGNSEEAFGRVVLATTKWERVTLDEGNSRVGQLQDTHWKALIDRGSKVQQFSDNHESAWEIVGTLLQGFVAEPGFDIKMKLAEFRKLQVGKDKTRNAREQFLRFFELFSMGSNSSAR